MRVSRVGIAVFAVPLIGLGALGLIHGDFAMVWQPVPSWVRGRELIAYLCGIVSLVSGLGLLWRRTMPAASAIAFIYLLLWLVLLRVPAIFISKQNRPPPAKGCATGSVLYTLPFGPNHSSVH